MSNNNFNNVGDELKRTINDAIVTGNFTELTELINGTVNGAIDVARKTTQDTVNDINKSISDSVANTANSYNRATGYNVNKKPNATDAYRNSSNVARNGYTVDSNGQKTVYMQNGYKPKPKLNVRINKDSKVTGILKCVFGGIGLGITVMTLLINLILVVAAESVSPISLVFTLGIAALFGWMINSGVKTQELVKKAERFAKLSGNNKYIDVSDLASSVGTSKAKVIKDIRKMLDKGIFPEGHLDDQETCLMLSNEVFKTYRETENARKAREAEERAKNAPQANNTPEQVSELDAMMQEGQECIRRLREMNDAIEGEVISNKLFRLENLLKEIFEQVKQHPEKMPQMHKFMDYYLPTTLKMVEAYSEFDDVQEPGPEIIEAKTQIENTLDTINGAFNELLNNLFKERVYDVTTDAQVLQTLLSKEGLVNSDFDQDKIKLQV